MNVVLTDRKEGKKRLSNALNDDALVGLFFHSEY
jgi:hypothetical protein